MNPVLFFIFFFSEVPSKFFQILLLVLALPHLRHKDIQRNPKEVL